MDELSPDLVMLKAGIRIYPGTELEKIARREGMVADDDDLLRPAFYLSPAVRDWVRDYLDAAIRDRGNWKI
jgi:hypothetical protein